MALLPTKKRLSETGEKGRRRGTLRWQRGDSGGRGGIKSTEHLNPQKSKMGGGGECLGILGRVEGERVRNHTKNLVSSVNKKGRVVGGGCVG